MNKPRLGKLRDFLHSEASSTLSAQRVKRGFSFLLGCRGLILHLMAPALCIANVSAQTHPAPASVQDHLHRAEVFLKANDLDSARQEFEAVLALDPKNAEAHANLGVIAFSHRDCDTASKDFRKALASDPSLAKTEALLGICEKKLGDPSARALLEKSFPRLKDKQLRLQAGMELASLYEQQGDPGGTASVMQTLVNLDPDNVDVLFMAQHVYSELADNTLNKLAMLAPGSARMQQVIAERLVNGADLKDAIEHYRQALQIDPRLTGAHFELGEAILETGRADADTEAQAQKEFETAVAVDGDTAKTECEFGDIALLQSKPDEAFAHYQRAFHTDPTEVQAQMGLAKLLLQEKPEEAVKYLRMAVESDPLNGSAHYQLAQAYRRLQMSEEAQKEMRLFQEIKAAKDQVEELYHQMNLPRPQIHDDNLPESQQRDFAPPNIVQPNIVQANIVQPNVVEPSKERR
jgi:tetratricopeptide (TPR) repeat protein